jgi:hypothetical protein
MRHRVQCRGPRDLGCVLILLAMTLLVCVARGAAPPTLEESAAAIERASQAPDGDRIVVGHISRKLATPVSTLRLQRQQTGLGWGDILIANRLSRETGLTVDQIVAEHGGGKAWGEIVRDHHVDLGKLLADVQDSQLTVERRSEDRASSGTNIYGESGPTPAPKGSNSPTPPKDSGSGGSIGGIGSGGSTGIGRTYR